MTTTKVDDCVIGSLGFIRPVRSKKGRSSYVALLRLVEVEQNVLFLLEYEHDMKSAMMTIVLTIMNKLSWELYAELVWTPKPLTLQSELFGSAYSTNA